MNNQRILIITRNLPPLVGGMERLNWHMADELSKYAEVKIIAPKGSAALKPENVTITECPLKPLPLFMLVALCKAIWLALTYKPTTVLAGSGLTAPLAWLASKLAGAKSAAYLHGLDITVQSKPYQKIWVPFFKRLDHIIVNSTPTKQLALNAGIQEEKIGIVYPGVEIPNAPQPAEAIQAFKQKHQLEDKKILLSVGRLTTRKGLKEFVENALPNIVKKVPNALLLVVGEAPKNSLGAGIQTRDEIEKAAHINHISNNIVFLGKVNEQILNICFELAHLHIFPIRYIKDDPEGFGMVAIEAAAHGLPTIAFATGGVIDAVKNEYSGYLVKSGDYNELGKKVIEALQLNKTSWRDNCKVFASSFEWQHFGINICTIIQSQMQKKE
ncbi:MAG: glycosyltransferase family 4 protein [Venatoribacter sp.]